MGARKFSKRKIALYALLAMVLLLGGALFWVHHLLFDRTKGEYFDSKGTRIFYTSEGQPKADPVILIHGLAAHADINWRSPGITGMLDRDFHVVSFDLRGHGLSDRPHDPAQYGIETVEDITRLMDHLHIEKAHLAGYSLGGFLALKFAVLHPERCLSLAVCASGWKDPDSMEPLRNPYRDDPDARLPDNEKKYRKIMRGYLEPQKMGMRLETAPWMRPGINEAGILPAFSLGSFDGVRDYFSGRVVDRDAIHALKDSLPAFIVTAADLKACTIPTICLMGTHDGLKPYAMDLKKAMPQCELVLIPGASHITTVLYGQFKSTLQDFLLKHRTKQ